MWGGSTWVEMWLILINIIQGIRYKQVSTNSCWFSSYDDF